MSLPTTGRFVADFHGARITFDGAAWSSDAERFDEFFAADLAAETRRHNGQHITADVVARRVLDRIFPGWTEISFQADAWPAADELPEDAQD